MSDDKDKSKHKVINVRLSRPLYERVMILSIKSGFGLQVGIEKIVEELVSNAKRNEKAEKSKRD